jgi:hypothetical protein
MAAHYTVCNYLQVNRHESAAFLQVAPHAVTRVLSSLTTQLDFKQVHNTRSHIFDAQANYTNTYKHTGVFNYIQSYVCAHT